MGVTVCSPPGLLGAYPREPSRLSWPINTQEQVQWVVQQEGSIGAASEIARGDARDCLVSHGCGNEPGRSDSMHWDGRYLVGVDVYREWPEGGCGQDRKLSAAVMGSTVESLASGRRLPKGGSCDRGFHSGSELDAGVRVGRVGRKSEDSRGQPRLGKSLKKRAGFPMATGNPIRRSGRSSKFSALVPAENGRCVTLPGWLLVQEALEYVSECKGWLERICAGRGPHFTPYKNPQHRDSFDLPAKIGEREQQEKSPTASAEGVFLTTR